MPFSFSQILSAAGGEPALLGPESAGFLILQVLESSGMQPLQFDPRCVLLAPNGTVTTGPLPETTASDADRRLRQMLQRSLRCATSEHLGLLRVSQSPARGLSQLRDELITALVPLNRQAARRALIRLHRRLEEAGEDIEAPAAEAWTGATSDEPTAPEPQAFEVAPAADEVTEPMVLSDGPEATSAVTATPCRFAEPRARALARFRARPSNVSQLLDAFTNETFGSTLEVQDELRRVADASNELSRTPPPVAESPDARGRGRRRNPKQAMIAGLAAIGALALLLGFRAGSAPGARPPPVAPSACEGTVVVQTRPRAEVQLIDATRTIAAAGPSARFEGVACDSRAEIVVRLDPHDHQAWTRLPLTRARLQRSSAEKQPLVLSVFEEDFRE